MKKEKKKQSLPLLWVGFIVVLLIAASTLFHSWNGLNTSSPQSTPNVNQPSTDFVFGRVVSKNPNEFIKTDSQSKKNIFNNGSISFVFDASRFTISKFDLEDATSGSGIKMENIIVQSTTGNYSLEIQLKLDGIGGGCPDFPKGYSLSQINISGRNVTKAKFVDKTDSSEAWPVGRIYLVAQTRANGQMMWSCPNVAGLESLKNGSSWIVYNLEKFSLNSSEYRNAEKSLDEIVSSIQGFW